MSCAAEIEQISNIKLSWGSTLQLVVDPIGAIVVQPIYAWDTPESKDLLSRFPNQSPSVRALHGIKATRSFRVFCRRSFGGGGGATHQTAASIHRDHASWTWLQEASPTFQHTKDSLPLGIKTEVHLAEQLCHYVLENGFWPLFHPPSSEMKHGTSKYTILWWSSKPTLVSFFSDSNYNLIIGAT